MPRTPNKGAIAVIPGSPSRARKYPLDKQLYAQRHLVECCFSRLKQVRRVATRFEKTAKNYLAIITLAATVLATISVHAASGQTAPRAGRGKNGLSFEATGYGAKVLRF